MSGGLLPTGAFTMWLAQGDRGMSSEAIVTRLTGVPISRRSRSDIPYDPSDFRRCELLLRQVPLARLAFNAMRDVSPAWNRLVDAWAELVALGESEVPDAFNSERTANGKAPLMYARMAELRREAAS
jgi:hypothetical protein